MKQARFIMGMPVVIEIIGNTIPEKVFNNIFSYFREVDNRFSPFKKNSEVSQINNKSVAKQMYTREMKEILELGEKTKKDSYGYFDMYHSGKFDPSGIVKGWAILNAAKLIKDMGYTNFYVEAGGDIEMSGVNSKQKKWSVGIKNPFNPKEIIKVIHLSGCGIATSGTYEKGQHIYNPVDSNKIPDIVSMTVVGPNVLEADRFATAAFAMGKEGIQFISSITKLEGYMIDREGIATYTKGFERYI